MLPFAKNNTHSLPPTVCHCAGIVSLGLMFKSFMKMKLSCQPGCQSHLRCSMGGIPFKLVQLLIENSEPLQAVGMKVAILAG